MARVGTCKDCGTRYKIPDTVQATRARCKKCSGVVEIPAAPDPPAAPTASPGRSRSAPSARPASKGGAPEGGPAAPARRAQGAKPPARAAPARARAGQGAAARKGRKPPGKPGRRTDAQAPARRPVGARPRAGRAAGGRARAQAQEGAGQRSPMLIGGLVAAVIVLGGAAAWTFDWFGGESTPPGDPAEVAAAPTAGAADALAGSVPEAGTPVAPAPEPVTEEPAEKAPAPLPVPTKPSDEPRDPVVDFFEPLPPMKGTTPEQLTEWTDLVRRTFVDAPPPRARRRLMGQLDEIDIIDMTPAFINALSGLDMSDPIVVRDTYNLMEYWTRRQAHEMHFFFEGDVSRTGQDAIDSRVKVIEAWVGAWRRKQADPENLARYRGEVEAKLAAGEDR